MKFHRSQGYVTLPALKCENTQSIANQGTSFELQCPKFVLEFYYIGMAD